MKQTIKSILAFAAVLLCGGAWAEKSISINFCQRDQGSVSTEQTTVVGPIPIASWNNTAQTQDSASSAATSATNGGCEISGLTVRDGDSTSNDATKKLRFGVSGMKNVWYDQSQGTTLSGSYLYAGLCHRSGNNSDADIYVTNTGSDFAMYDVIVYLTAAAAGTETKELPDSFSAIQVNNRWYKGEANSSSVTKTVSCESTATWGLTPVTSSNGGTLGVNAIRVNGLYGTLHICKTSQKNIGIAAIQIIEAESARVGDEVTWSNTGTSNSISANNANIGESQLNFKLPAKSGLPVGSVVKIKKVTFASPHTTFTGWSSKNSDAYAIKLNGVQSDWVNGASQASAAALSADKKIQSNSETSDYALEYTFSSPCCVAVGQNYVGGTGNNEGQGVAFLADNSKVDYGGGADYATCRYVQTSDTDSVCSVTQTTVDSGYYPVYEVTAEVVFIPSSTTVSFDVNVANKPTTAMTAYVGTEVTAFANNADYNQTVGGHTATVTSLCGATGDFVVIAGVPLNGGSPTKDVWLSMDEGSCNAIIGAGNSAYPSSSQIGLTGNVYLQLGGTAAVNYIHGGFYQEYKNPTLTGNIDIVVKDDAVINRGIVGAGMAYHNDTAKYVGDVNITVKNVQSTNTQGAIKDTSTTTENYIIGGGAYGWNGTSKEWVTGNTSILIDIPAGKSGNFVKNIVGGGYIPEGGGGYSNPTMLVDGKSSVTINAPDTVNFTGTIVAGGYKLHSGNGSATVGGTATVTLNGGTYLGSIKAGTATGTKTLSVNGDITVKPDNTAIDGFGVLTIADSKTMTIEATSAKTMSLAVPGTGTIVKTGAGVLTLNDIPEGANFAVSVTAGGLTLNGNANGMTIDMNSESGILSLGTSRPTVNVRAGKVKFTATDAEISRGTIVVPVPSDSAEASAEKVTVLDGVGQELKIASVEKTSDTQLTITLQKFEPITATKSISELQLSDDATGTLEIRGAANEDDAFTVTFDTALPAGVLVVVSGHVKFEATEGNTIPFGTMTYNAGTAITMPSASDITIPNGLIVTIGTPSGDITNNGTLNVTGTCSFKLINNDSGVVNFKRGADATVSSNNQSIHGTVNVEKDATFTNVTNDAVAWEGTGTTFNVYGTLAMGGSRWTIGTSSMLNLYGGCEVTGGAVEGHVFEGSFDLYHAGDVITVNADPTGTSNEVTIDSYIRARNNSTNNPSGINVAENMTLIISGGIKDNSTESNVACKRGSGKLVVESELSNDAFQVIAGTLKFEGINPTTPVTVNANGKLELSQPQGSDYEVTSALSGSGRISCVSGTATISNCANFTGNLQAEGANSKLVVNSDLTASIYDNEANSGTIEIPVGKTLTTSAFAGAKKVLVNGTYKFTSTTQMDLRQKNLSFITGSGEMYITGSKYFILPKQDWMWSSDLTIVNDRGGDNADNNGIIFGVPNNNYVIGNLSGTGLFRTDYDAGNRNVKIIQSKDTTWSGLFRGTDRLGTFEVDGKAGVEGSHVLTLATTNPNTHENALKVDQNGSVKLTGAWKGDVTVNGRFEKMNDATCDGTISDYSGILTKSDSLVYFGSDEIASAEAKAKLGSEYYATVEDAINALSEEQDITAIKIIAAGVELPAEYADYAIAADGSIVAAGAKIGTKGYVDFAAAKAAATTGCEIVLLKDLSLAEQIGAYTLVIPEGITVTASTSPMAWGNSNSKIVLKGTLDLTGGHVPVENCSFELHVGATIKGATDDREGLFAITNAEKFSIVDSGSSTRTITVAGNICIRTNVTLTIPDNVVMTVTGNLRPAYWQGGTGGVVTKAGNGTLVLGGNLITTPAAVSLTVTAGEVQKTLTTAEETFTITETSPGTAQVTSGVTGKVVKYTESTKTYSLCTPVAMIVDGGSTTYYETLADAVANVGMFKTVTLLADVELTETLVVPVGKYAYLDMAGYSITMASGVSTEAILVKESAILYLKNTTENASGIAANGDTAVVCEGAMLVYAPIVFTGKVKVVGGAGQGSAMAQFEGEYARDAAKTTVLLDWLTIDPNKSSVQILYTSASAFELEHVEAKMIDGVEYRAQLTPSYITDQQGRVFVRVGITKIARAIKPGTTTEPQQTEPTAEDLAEYAPAPVNDEADAAGQAELLKVVKEHTDAGWVIKSVIDPDKEVVINDEDMTIMASMDVTAVAFAQGGGLEAVAGATGTTAVTIPAAKVVSGLYYSVSYGTSPDNHTAESDRVLATGSNVTIYVPALGNEKVYFIKIKASAEPTANAQ